MLRASLSSVFGPFVILKILYNYKSELSEIYTFCQLDYGLGASITKLNEHN